jgi:hypothetical protein
MVLKHMILRRSLCSKSEFGGAAKRGQAYATVHTTFKFNLNAAWLKSESKVLIVLANDVFFAVLLLDFALKRIRWRRWNGKGASATFNQKYELVVVAGCIRPTHSN